MATTWCPDLSGDPAIIAVGQAHDKFMELGTFTYNLAIGNLDGLNNVDLTPVDFTVNFDFVDPQATFRRPVRPQFDDAALEFRDPGVSIPEAPAWTPGTVTITEPPDIEIEPPVLSFSAKPSAPNITMPVAPHDPVDIVMPIEPDYPLPDVPTFESLHLPDVPSITLPEFEGQRPEPFDPPFDDSWTFDPKPYVGTLVDTLVDTLRPMIVGSEALPQVIERAIFERGRSRIEVENRRAIDQASAEFASRGFSEPPGMLSGRISDLIQAGHNQIAEFSRDTAIKQFEESLASQRFAITQGAALEGTLIQLHVEEQRTLLQAATFQRESAIAVLNARVQIFNVQLAAYQTDAQVFRERIQAELAKVEIFKAQVDAELARGQINEQRVRLYEAQLRGVVAMADFYRQRVETVKVQADINKLAIDRFHAEVDAYEVQWRAHIAEWQGYSASIEGESKRVDLYRSMVDAAAKRVDAWSSMNSSQIELEKLRLSQHGMSLDVWRTAIQRFEALLGAERARLAAVGQSVDAKARIYTADADVEQAASAAADRSFELGLAAARARVDTQLKTADMRIQQALGLLAQYVEIQKAKATISAQLAASTMSAVHYGASISSGRNKSTSCSQNFSFQGEIIDA
ncbi:MAG: hypothetical protein LBL59_08690 [Xanthomonadaceae bacterium]|jgi:hypothetical protein|nr:hypothetical protein [Xanthomonadaceae bacterium]